jgi:hypothetical protein
MSFSFHVESDFVWGSSWIGGDFLRNLQIERINLLRAYVA